MDIEKEKEAFEAIAENIRLLRGAKFKDGEYVALSLFDESSKELAAQLNYGWAMWLSAIAQAVPKWISVEDELPSDGQDVIAFDAIKHCVFKGGEFLQGYFEPDTGHEYTEPVDVTHWIAIEAQESAK